RGAAGIILVISSGCIVVAGSSRRSLVFFEALAEDVEIVALDDRLLRARTVTGTDRITERRRIKTHHVILGEHRMHGVVDDGAVEDELVRDAEAIDVPRPIVHV